MKRTLLATIVALLPLCAFAQRADMATLRIYATKAMPRCPGSVITLDQLPSSGPAGFIPYDLTQTSTDKYCGSKKTLLYSPASQQIVVGTVFPLAPDQRPDPFLVQVPEPRWPRRLQVRAGPNDQLFGGVELVVPAEVAGDET